MAKEIALEGELLADPKYRESLAELMRLGLREQSGSVESSADQRGSGRCDSSTN